MAVYVSAVLLVRTSTSEHVFASVPVCSWNRIEREDAEKQRSKSSGRQGSRKVGAHGNEDAQSMTALTLPILYTPDPRFQNNGSDATVQDMEAQMNIWVRMGTKSRELRL